MTATDSLIRLFTTCEIVARDLAKQTDEMGFTDDGAQDMAEQLNELSRYGVELYDLAEQLWQDKEDEDEAAEYRAAYNARDYFDERALFNPAELRG